MPAASKPHVTIYTDGGAVPNPGSAGYGVVLLCGRHRKELSGGFEVSTNNRMELLAVIVGLEALKRPCRVTVYSDSRYVVDAIGKQWALKWQKNDWWRNKHERARNIDLWRRFLRVSRKHELTMMWVKGHAGHPENERCDYLASRAQKAANRDVDPGFRP